MKNKKDINELKRYKGSFYRKPPVLFDGSQEESFRLITSTGSNPVFVTGFSESTSEDKVQDIDFIIQQQKLLSEKFDSLFNRQSAVESTQTDWIMSLDTRIQSLENDIVQEKERLKKNVNILIEIGQLQDNWDQYGAKKFNQELIFKCLTVINETNLKYQPEIFPTGRNSIQLEYEPDKDHYLEIEIFNETIKLYKRIKNHVAKAVDISLETTINLINEFQSKFGR